MTSPLGQLVIDERAGRRITVSRSTRETRIRVSLESITAEQGRGVRETWIIEDTKDRLF